MAFVGTCLLVASCGDGTQPAPLAADHVEFALQPAATLSAADAFEPLVVAVRAANGEIVRDYDGEVTLALNTTDTSAHLQGQLTMPVSRGMAVFPGLTLHRAGTFTLSATSAAMSATSNSFSITPGVASGTRIGGDVRGGTAGQPIFEGHEAGLTQGPLTVNIVDSWGNVIPTATNPITLHLASDSPADTLFGTTTRSAVSGQAMFDDLVLHKAGIHTLFATAPGLADSPGASVAVIPGDPVTLSLSQQPQNGVVGSILPSVSVGFLDVYGNELQYPLRNVTGVAVTLTLSTNPTGATLSGTLMKPSFRGASVFNDLQIDKAGTGYVLTASAPNLPSVTSAPFDVVP